MPISFTSHQLEWSAKHTQVSRLSLLRFNSRVPSKALKSSFKSAWPEKPTFPIWASIGVITFRGKVTKVVGGHIFLSNQGICSEEAICLPIRDQSQSCFSQSCWRIEAPSHRFPAPFWMAAGFRWSNGGTSYPTRPLPPGRCSPAPAAAIGLPFERGCVPFEMVKNTGFVVPASKKNWGLSQSSNANVVQCKKEKRSTTWRLTTNNNWMVEPSTLTWVTWDHSIGNAAEWQLIITHITELTRCEYLWILPCHVALQHLATSLPMENRNLTHLVVSFLFWLCALFFPPKFVLENPLMFICMHLIFLCSLPSLIFTVASFKPALKRKCQPALWMIGVSVILKTSDVPPWHLPFAKKGRYRMICCGCV